MVTVATVGYGDLSPVTPIGRIIAMFTFVTALPTAQAEAMFYR